MNVPEYVQLIVQTGALGLLGLVLWKVVLPLVSAVRAVETQLAVQTELLRELATDIYNGRCRYGAPSAGSYRAVRPPKDKGPSERT